MNISLLNTFFGIDVVDHSSINFSPSFRATTSRYILLLVTREMSLPLHDTCIRPEICTPNVIQLSPTFLDQRPTMSLPEAVSRADTYRILITGANSYVGLICSKNVDTNDR